ncbi:hypothetical protein N0V83_007954 [Neocucurbitaria cava]|uniref:Uncharacterized protein n=1 Tax=Neocucurbitaria cava TaxID=798079 RepID=A0A9W8Y2N3_9PLEO|nr:hypothetical protein N0V83_007954 [Neocucurbitaria cava]
MKPILDRMYRLGVLSAPTIFFLIAIALVGWHASFAQRPGPKDIRSHFSGLVFAAVLAFDALQLLKLVLWPSKRQNSRRRIISRFLDISAKIYWVVLTVSALICAVGYGFTPNSDAVAIQVLTLLNGAVALTKFSVKRFIVGRNVDKGHATLQLPEQEQVSLPKWKRYLFAIGRHLNRLLKVVRFILSILFIVGALGLARQYRFENPGTLTSITLPSGSSLSINYHCITAAAASAPSTENTTTSSSLPTIWFVADQAHGITDFLGSTPATAAPTTRQTSAGPRATPSSEALDDDLTGIFPPLLHALQRETEETVLAGWGAGGENVLRYARQAAPSSSNNNVKGVVLLDVSPTGIEWLDQKRARNLSDEETVAVAKADLDGRAALAQISLAVDLPWYVAPSASPSPSQLTTNRGILPLFLPPNATGYFDSALYPRHHAQSLKEDMWAMQYYSLLTMASNPNPFSPVLEDLAVPHGIPVYVVASYVAGTGGDEASSAFYRGGERRGWDELSRVVEVGS